MIRAKNGRDSIKLDKAAGGLWFARNGSENMVFVIRLARKIKSEDEHTVIPLAGGDLTRLSEDQAALCVGIFGFIKADLAVFVKIKFINSLQKIHIYGIIIENIKEDLIC